MQLGHTLLVSVKTELLVQVFGCAVKDSHQTVLQSTGRDGPVPVLGKVVNKWRVDHVGRGITAGAVKLLHVELVEAPGLGEVPVNQATVQPPTQHFPWPLGAEENGGANVGVLETQSFENLPVGQAEHLDLPAVVTRCQVLLLVVQRHLVHFILVA